MKGFKMLAVLLAALLFAAPVTSLAEQGNSLLGLGFASEEQMQPIEAQVMNLQGGASNLTNHADDYEVPQGTYFNGTPVTILAVEETMGDYPIEYTDEQQRWAKVRIGRNDSYGGIIGMMPLANLAVKAEDPVELPSGALIRETAVLADNGISPAEIGTFPAGSEVRLLGWLKDWLHIKVGGKTGFVRQEDVQLSEEDMERVYAALPLGFDEIQPGYQQHYADYMAKLMELYDKHGDSNYWPLDVAAYASRLAEENGYLFGDSVHILPDDTDLSEDKVKDIAQKTAEELYSLGGDNWSDISLSYFYYPGDPANHVWKASLWAKPGKPDIKVWLNSKGEVIGTLNSELPVLDEMLMNPEEALKQAQGTLEYYLYGKKTSARPDELDEAAAIEKAWEEFTGKTGQKDRGMFTFETSFFTNDEETLRWWLVSIARHFAPDMAIYYHVALLMPDGATNYQTAAEVYRVDQQWADDMIVFLEKEKEMGPFHTWPLEEKAKSEPEYFGLPSDGEVTEADATAKAAGEIMAKYGLSADELGGYDIGVFFIIHPERVWQISFFDRNPTPDSEASGYTAVIDAKTGKLTDLYSNEYEGE